MKGGDGAGPGDGEGVGQCRRGLGELSDETVQEAILELEPRGEEGCRFSGGENLLVGAGTLETFVPGVGLTWKALGKSKERERM